MLAVRGSGKGGGSPTPKFLERVGFLLVVCTTAPIPTYRLNSVKFPFGKSEEEGFQPLQGRSFLTDPGLIWVRLWRETQCLNAHFAEP